MIGPRGAVELARRAAVGVGMHEVLLLERRVDRLADGIAENELLAEPLAARVARLEQSLLPALEHRHRHDPQDPPPV